MTTARNRLRVRLLSSGVHIVEPDGLTGPFPEIADAAAYSENRNHRRTKRRLKKPLHRRMIGAARVALAGLIASLAACSEPSSIDDAALQRVTQHRVAREIVSARLRDPHSAQFADLSSGELEGIATVCGTVNARNALGGYAGPERFIVGGDSAFFESDASAELFESLWRDACIPPIADVPAVDDIPEAS